MTRRALLIGLFLLATLQWRCIQSYVSPYSSPATGSGYYLLSSISMSAGVEYRLRIGKVNNEEYLSDYIPYKPTPPIDSTVWTSDSAGITIYTNTHDPTGNTRYYQWKYSETWELTAWERSNVVYQGDTLAQRTPGQQIYTCWKTDSSSDILIGTSKQLSGDVINRMKINFFPINTEQLGIEYSIQVSQYAITDSGFTYLTLMKSNTEQLGSVMDPLPAQLIGNIHCLTHRAEVVIGYISAGTLQQQRIFIQRSQVPGWLYYFACPFKNITVGSGNYYLYFDRLSFTPIGPVTADGTGGAYANYNDCIDCRARDHASNQQPAFWR